MIPDLTILPRLVELLRERSAVDTAIGALIERPVARKHIGDFLAAELFGLTLNDPLGSLHDATFASGALEGRSVALRWYPHHQRLIDLVKMSPPDYYLVLTGPAADTISEHGLSRPLAIHAAYIFDSRVLHPALAARKVNIGVGTLLDPQVWEAAEIYPRQISPLLTLTDAQRASIEQFRFAEVAL